MSLFRDAQKDVIQEHLMRPKMPWSPVILPLDLMARDRDDEVRRMKLFSQLKSTRALVAGFSLIGVHEGRAPASSTFPPRLA